MARLRSQSCWISSQVDPSINSHRSSCSTPITTRLSGINYNQKIPQTQCEESVNQSPPISPTYSQMAESKDLEICVITKDYEINKKRLREEIVLDKNKEKREKFFKKFTITQRNELQEEYYKFLENIQTQTFFFNWFDTYKNKTKKVNMLKNKIIVS